MRSEQFDEAATDQLTAVGGGLFSRKGRQKEGEGIPAARADGGRR
jgi:hypothetical protein